MQVLFNPLHILHCFILWIMNKLEVFNVKLLFLFHGKGICFHLLLTKFLWMPLTFRVLLCSSNSLALIMLKFAPVYRRCLSMAASIVRRLSSTHCRWICVPPQELFESAAQFLFGGLFQFVGQLSPCPPHFETIYSCVYRLCRILVQVFSLNFCKLSGVAALKMGRGLFCCCTSFSISSVNVLLTSGWVSQELKNADIIKGCSHTFLPYSLLVK